jgi:oligoendopeptidase F
MVRAVAAADAATAGETALGPLPEWDLDDLYPGRDSPELARDLAELARQAKAFRERYEGRLAGLSGGELGAAVVEYENLQEVAGRIISYAELTRAGNFADPEIARFFQTRMSASTRSRPSCCSSRSN